MFAIGLRPLTWFQVLFLYFSIHFVPACVAQDGASSHDATATAQARNPDPSTTPTQSTSISSVPARTHTVEVGLADHKFRPDVTEAAIGDTVEFSFYPVNHSVVRAEYGFPCVPYEKTGSKKVGFFSGFNPVDKVLDNPPKYSLRINDTDPIFFYCSAPGSCITYGMVGVINSNASVSIDKQRGFAMDSAYMLNPGEPFPAESPLPSTNPATSSGITSPSDTGKKGLSAGAIGGIVVGAIGGLVLGALLFFFWGRTKTLKDEVKRKESSVTRRISPSASATNMLQTQPPPPPSGPGGLGIYQHYAPNRIANSTVSPTSPDQLGYGTPAPSYFSPQPHLDTASERKYMSTSPPPQAHPAFATPTHRQGYSDLANPLGIDAMSPSHSYLYSDTQSYFPRILPHHHRTHSPPFLSTPSPTPPGQKPILGPYGQQRDAMGPAPPYGWHVNRKQGPVEMEGETGRGRTGERARWEEVQPEGKEGMMI